MTRTLTCVIGVSGPQGRVAWGTSSNSVSPFLSYTDKFSSTRWLLASTLAGRWDLGPWSFRPSASVSYIEDNAQL